MKEHFSSGKNFYFSIITTLTASFLFGAGLEISQMTNPEKVIGFLNLFEKWDPSLAFVMGGAILVNALLYQIIIRKKRPLLAPEFMIPTNNKVDKNLLIGAAVFGIGWGMGGFCPGPAIAGLFRGQTEILIVVVSILAGMFSYNTIFMKK